IIRMIQAAISERYNSSIGDEGSMMRIRSWCDMLENLFAPNKCSEQTGVLRRGDPVNSDIIVCSLNPQSIFAI
ncbi:MAG: hypothetical protein ACE5G1_02015, partial [bacterium]